MTMMIPVRCFTCGAVIGQTWDEYRERTSRGEPAGEVLTKLGLTRVPAADGCSSPTWTSWTRSDPTGRPVEGARRARSRRQACPPP